MVKNWHICCCCVCASVRNGRARVMMHPSGRIFVEFEGGETFGYYDADSGVTYQGRTRVYWHLLDGSMAL